MQNDIYNAVILIYLPYYQVRIKQLWMESFKKQFALYAAIYAKCLILSLFQYNGMVKIIENYTLHEQIGEGEYGKVYRGVDGRSGKEVAVKVINVKRFKDNPKLQQCTLNQIEVLTKIDSPHIVKFIEILKTINNFYFFYQFCNGGTLDQEIKKTGILSEEKILSFLQQLLEAFKILSANNIMHRDLKPTNILLHNGKIKLGDFGFCKSLQNQRDLAQTMLGSPIYMAPEVLKGQIYTIKADIWSLGVVVYEMCFGFCPFQQSSIARLINVLEYQELQFNKEINPISSQMENFIKKMLIKDHFKRITWEELFAINLKFNTISKQNSNQSNYSHHNRALSEFNRNNRPSDLQYNKEEKLYDNKFMKKKKNAEEEHRNIQNLHENIASVIKLVDKTIESCENQQLILPLVLRIYKIVLVQHEKLGSKKQFMRERGEISDAIMQVESLMSNDKGLADDFQRLLKNRNKKNANCNQLIAYISNHSINQQNTSAMYLNAKTLQKLLLEAKFLNNSY